MRVLLAGTIVSALVACSSLLDVKNPNDISEGALANPAAATAMANGVLASTVRALSGMTTPYAVATDELDWIGSRDAWLELDKGIIGNPFNEFTDQAFPYAGEARFLADANIGRLEAFDADSRLANRADLARTYLYAAVIYASIADMYDDFAFSSKTIAAAPIGRARMSELYDAAIDYLDKANTLANAAGANADLVALRYPIIAFRARVKYAKAVWGKITPVGTTPNPSPLVNDAGANADAAAAIALGSADEAFNLVDNIEATAVINIWFEVNGRNENAIGETYKTLNDPVTGALDPTAQASTAAFTDMGSQDGVFTITSTRELHLILAEAALQAASSATFRTELNTVRQLDGKPDFTGQNGLTDLDILKHERMAQLWLMRRRLTDMHRFGVTDTKWVVSPTSSVPDALTVNGLLFPIPNVERLGNPCINDPSKCPS